MKCDLCGNKIELDSYFTCAEVENSKLCKACFNAVTAEVAKEIPSVEIVADDETVNLPEQSTDLFEKSICRSCDSICEEWQLFCPSCGIDLGKSFAEAGPAGSQGEEHSPLTFLDILGRIILTIIAIVVLVPLSLFVVCLVGSAFH